MSGGMEQLAREFGRATQYRVTLSFEPRLSAGEFERLRSARRVFHFALGGRQGRVQEGLLSGKTA